LRGCAHPILGGVRGGGGGAHPILGRKALIPTEAPERGAFRRSRGLGPEGWHHAILREIERGLDHDFEVTMFRV
jgi:hypothetical protein